MARVTKQLRSAATESRDLCLVVKGSEEQAVVAALDAVEHVSATSDSPLSPNFTGVSPLPTGDLSLVVDLKGEAEDHARFLDLLARELPESVILATAGGPAFDLISDPEGLVFGASVLSAASAEPTRAGLAMPHSWTTSIAESLAEISETNRLLCLDDESNILMEASPEHAIRWVDGQREPDEGSIIGAMLAIVSDDQLTVWQHLTTYADLLVYGVTDLDACERQLRKLIQRLDPEPLAATIEIKYQRDDIKDPTRYPRRGPELLNGFRAVGPTQWLPPAVATDPEFGSALEASGVEFELNGRLLTLGTAQSWRDMSIRREYQRLALTQLRPWKAEDPRKRQPRITPRYIE